MKDAISKLKKGFQLFRKNHYEDRKEEFLSLVTNGQKPEICVIACSDSRVDPAIILQADPGDLFVVRNVANLVPPHEGVGQYHGTSAALEYAVQHLQVKHIIVLGHAHCGGIHSLLNPEKEGSEGHQFLPPWMSLVEAARLRVMATMPDASKNEQSAACEQESVLVSLENLMTFPCIRERVSKGGLRLHGWYIDIEYGQLATYDASSRQFQLVD